MINSNSHIEHAYEPMKNLFAILIVFLPWSLRRIVLIKIFRYKLHPTARIGFSFVFPEQLEMGAHSSIGHLTVSKGLWRIQMGVEAIIGNLNWITGFPMDDESFFKADVGRRPELILGAHSAVTNRHMLDCTNSVRIGNFTTVAGTRSQILTHSIDLHQSRQTSKPIVIGEYCFVGTACVLLGGCALPDYSVLGACSLLNKQYSESYVLYAGNPAKPVKPLSTKMGYFTRSTGFVH
ncbi:acyltransferase [Occallatibacter savannae]|uniref:acyltransferase n=1 Tax=Occallatibacter savannae TaxID=1002691 RepID=UPI00194ED79B|nr:hypothetical protein [Occallatibacter savannae]